MRAEPAVRWRPRTSCPQRSPPSSSSAATGSARGSAPAASARSTRPPTSGCERPVAVKVIPSAERGDPSAAAREALAAGRLDHPGDRRGLRRRRGRARALPGLRAGPRPHAGRAQRRGRAVGPRRAADRARAVRRARARARRGVVHRDVKPQNVIIPDAPRSAAGVAKLADFGVAHLAGDEPLTRTGDVVGTLAYMAPEQAAGKRIDERGDLYSLALVLYEALAGANPVRAGSPAATARRVGTVLPPLRRAPQGPAGGAVRRRSTARCARARTSAGRSTTSPTSSPTSLPEVSDDGGTVAPHPLERTEPFGPLPRGVDPRRRGRARGRAGRRRAGLGRASRCSPRARRGRRGRGLPADRLAGRRRSPPSRCWSTDRAGAARARRSPRVAPGPAAAAPPRHRLVAARARAAAGPRRRSPAPTRRSPAAPAGR